MKLLCTDKNQSVTADPGDPAIRQTVCPYCRTSDWTDLGNCCELAELGSPDTPEVIREIAEASRDSKLAQCDRCGLLFRCPQPSRDDLRRLYRNLPATIWRYDSSSMGSWMTAKKHLLSQHPGSQPVSVLDVGAFDGGFLKCLPDTWRKYAVEPSPLGQEELRKSKIRWIADSAEDVVLDSEPDGFDVVTLFDVFEHLPDPAETLRVLADLVKPAGRLMVSTCNARHWSWRMMRGQHWYLHSVQHVCFANPAFFRSWGQQHGMKVESHFSHAHQIAGSTARLKHSLEVVHAWATQNGKYYLSRLIQSLPGMGHMAHKQGVVFANTLQDHQLVVFRRLESSTP
ncbi:Ubiquinone biosynthesis O-methyltransferase [Stieleria maiorica]|uniref:Ubiquinone biosynthesis O-methyltransferase n=1 Tax=Stieleria maiorica TaxID=2795974 RepID=A0A5B9MG60_9BACT|nr:class I SAM-dependent methyltransferase [Stieleria maiorica]QEF99489.1 Ubiquinone biosynthesis O-methyltransferase [Stieleria maiorica]